MRKKIVLCLILFFLGIQSVIAKGKVYYSPYSDYTDWSQKKVEGSDIVDVEKERRYMWSYDEIIRGDYTLLGDVTLEYPYQDEEKFQKTKWSTWQEEKPKGVKEREIEEKKLYRYQKLKKIRYLYIWNVKGGNQQLIIPELTVWNQKEKLDYDVICETCHPDFESKLQNEKMTDLNNAISNGTTFFIDLKKTYDIENLKLSIYLHDETNEKKSLACSFVDGMENPISIAELGASMEFEHQNKTEIEQLDLAGEYTYPNNPIWEEPKYSEKKIEATKFMKVTYGTFYRYRDTLYQQYQKIHHQTDDYRKQMDKPYQKEKDNYQDWYRYRVRDKVVLSENWTVTDPKFRWEDLVLEQTVPITFHGNLDLKKNGGYRVVLDLGFRTIEKELIIDILENDIDSYKAVTRDLEKVKKEIETIEQDEKVDTKQEELESLKKEASELFRKQKELKKKIMPVKTFDQHFWFQIPLIGLFLFLVLLLCYFGYRYYHVEK